MRARRVRLAPSAASILAAAFLAGAAAATFAGAEDGALDTSFAGDGRLQFAWSESATAYRVEALADGALLVASRLDDPAQWLVTKLTAGGALDFAWSTVADPFDFVADGAPEAYQMFDLERDGSDRTRIAGYVEDDDERLQMALARLTATGALDPAFGGNGRVIVSPLPLDWILASIHDAWILPDGSTVFTGRCGSCFAIPTTRGFLARVGPNGAPDPTFSSDGFVSFDIAGLTETNPTALSVSAAGAITVTGWGEWGGAKAAFLARFTASGAPDNAFSGDGVAPLLATEPRRPTSLAIDPDTGAIVIGMSTGVVADGGGLYGFTADGDLDSDFGDDATPGFVDLDFAQGVSIESVLFESGGRIVATGSVDPAGADLGMFFVARTLADGTLDVSFDGNGLKYVDFDAVADGQDDGWGATLSGGRLVVVGAALGVPLDWNFAVARLTSDLIFSDGFERGSIAGWAGY